MFGIHIRARTRECIIVDIGSGSAAVAYLELRTNMPSRIIVSERVSVSPAERTREQSLVAIGQALNDASKKAQLAYELAQHGGHAIAREVHCVVRAPWTHTHMSRGQKKFAVDKKISDSDIVSLAHEVLSSTVETLPGVEFEKKTVTIALNGYPTQKPEGKRAQTIDLDILRSSIESDVKSAIETELQRLFPHVQTHWHSHTRAALETLRSNSKSARDCTIIDVGSLSTTILSIRKGLIVESIDVPLGSQEICTRIAHKGMPEEVRAFLRMIEHDQCTSEACSAVVSAIALFEPEMVRTFGEACAKLTSQRRLPNVAYILSDPDLSPWLSRFFERIDFNQFTTTTRAFLVTRFDAKNAGSNIEYGPSVTPDDSMLLAGALVHTGEDGQ